MPDFCTCGAQLPPDALFCHKCGKPQRDLVTPEIEPNTYPAAVEASVAPPPPAPRLQPPPLNFHNPIAVRIALLAAVIATLLSFLPIVNWLAAGFFAVFFYCRKTGFRLDVAAGAKIGWMTGLITFTFSAVVLGLQQIPDALNGHLFRTMIEQLKESSFQDPTFIRMFENYPALALLLLLGVMFVMVSCLTTAGGALGAKVVGSPK